MNHTELYLGWTIVIVLGHGDVACFLTEPGGREHVATYPASRGVNGAISLARARINRLMEGK
jgi:hypothetical protein